VDDTCWDGHGLVGPQVQGLAIRQLDDETTIEDEEQLVRARMGVPGVLAGKDAHPKAMLIDLKEDLVAVGFDDRTCLMIEVDDLERRVADGFVGIGTGCCLNVAHGTHLAN